jgi:hypothetical protein
MLAADSDKELDLIPSKTLCLVSAFLDIGREKWKVYQRSISQYFNNFFPYIKLDHEMIVFMDDRYAKPLTEICKESKSIKVISINREWMVENIYAYSQLSREEEIMSSDSFKDLIKHRLFHPECSKPEYNIMQHAKIDFVSHVINNKLSDATYYAWSDFGYFQDPSCIPQYSLDIDKFDLEKVNFQGISSFTDDDFNILYTLQNAPERVGGFFYLGHPDQLLKYQQLYHEVCKDFHDKGIVDDDQHIMIQCIARQSSLFKVWNLGGWHLVYNCFQKTQ